MYRDVTALMERPQRCSAGPSAGKRTSSPARP